MDSSIIAECNDALVQEDATVAFERFLIDIRTFDVKDLRCFVSNLDLIKRYLARELEKKGEDTVKAETRQFLRRFFN